MPEKFSLKDALFNPIKVQKIAKEILGVYPSFAYQQFIDDVLEPFETLALKERIYHIRDILHKYLPSHYKEALKVLLLALPPELDNSKSDDDFGDFIYAPYAEFVLAYGCSEAYLHFSLDALRKMTKRFSVEFAIRDFINHYPKETFAMLLTCSLSTHYHERRLASEGLRPNLPWGKKIALAYPKAMQALENLYFDKTRYVTRSVANHLNDVAKRDAPLVIETLTRWKHSAKQDSKEMAFISKHALRTLIKRGDTEALAFLGYLPSPSIDVGQMLIHCSEIHIGESLEFSVKIEAKDDVNLMVDYILYFMTKSGKRTPKVYKLKQLALKKLEHRLLSKKHPLRANMSTRTLYAGVHKLELQINGTIVHSRTFILKNNKKEAVIKV